MIDLVCPWTRQPPCPLQQKGENSIYVCHQKKPTEKGKGAVLYDLLAGKEIAKVSVVDCNKNISDREYMVWKRCETGHVKLELSSNKGGGAMAPFISCLQCSPKCFPQTSSHPSIPEQLCYPAPPHNNYNNGDSAQSLLNWWAFYCRWEMNVLKNLFNMSSFLH